MGPVHHKFVRLLACLVALDLVVGVAALYVRDGFAGASSAASSPPAADAPGAEGASGANSSGGGILAAGNFTNRRRAPQASAGTNGASGTNGADGTPGANGTPGTGVTATTAAPSTTATTARATAPTTAKAPTAGKGAPAGANAAKPGGPAQPTLSFDDAVGDTVVDGAGTARVEPKADIVQSRANYISKAIILAAKGATAADPVQDPNWTSDSTYVSWELDTTGDGTPDFEVQYYLIDGTPVAGVSRVGDEDVASVCDAEAGVTADGYTIGFEPACVGNPAKFSYRVTIYYDSNPADETADVITDVAPNGGLTRPVTRPAG